MNLANLDASAMVAAGLQVVVLAAVIERIANLIKKRIPERFQKAIKDWLGLLTLVFGVVVCLAYGADVLFALGLPAKPIWGPVLTGLLAGGGSNYIHEFMEGWRSRAPAPAVVISTAPAPPPPQEDRPQ